MLAILYISIIIFVKSISDVCLNMKVTQNEEMKEDLPNNLVVGLRRYEGNYGLYKTINGKPSWKKGFQEAIWYDKKSKKYVMGSLWQIADDLDEIPNDFGQSPVDQKVIGGRRKNKSGMA